MMVFFVLSLFMIADAWMDGDMISPGYSYWLSVMGLYAATLFLAIPPTFYNKSTFYAIFTVPILAFSMVRAILHIRQNRAVFLHTPKIYSGDD
jgi:hypothetical protein